MPTENRSSNTEMLSAPREHELKIRQTPLADLLSGLKTGEIRDCSDREFAVGDTVLLREVDEARDYTGTVARRTITHVQKNYGLPDHLCVLSYGQPAPQPHPEPIAWMVGTAFWWNKEGAEKDAAVTGLPVVGLGPMACAAPDKHHQGEPVLWRYRKTPARSWFYTVHKRSAEIALRDGYIVEELYAHADPGEVEQMRTELVEWKDRCQRNNDDAMEWMAKHDTLRAQMAERDALLRESSGKLVQMAAHLIGAPLRGLHDLQDEDKRMTRPRVDSAVDFADARLKDAAYEIRRIANALSASAELNAQALPRINGHKFSCKAVDDYKPGECSCSAEPLVES